MILAAIGLPLVMAYTFRDELKYYFYNRKWSKKTEAERYAEFQRLREEYNTTGYL